MFSRIHPFISYLSLLAVAGYCCFDFYTKKGFGDGIKSILEFPYITYLVMTLRGMIGCLIYGLDSTSYNLWKWSNDIEILLKTVSYPCLVTEMWLKYDVIQPEVAWLHAIVGSIPAGLFVFNNRLKKNWIDVVVYLNTVSLLAVSFLNSNNWGLAAGATFIAGFFILRKRSDLLKIEPDLWFNYFIAASCYCGHLALGSS